MLLVGRELPAKASRASSPSKTHLEKSSPPLPRWLPPPSRSPSTSTDHAIQSHHPPTLGKRRRHFGAHAPPPPPPPPQAPTGLNKKASSLTRPPSGSSAASAQTTLLLSPSSSPSTSATRPTPTPSQTPAACCRSSRPPKWKWFGLPPAHKRLDLGFLANAIQLFGAVAFEVSVICGLPGVLGKSGAVGGVEQEGRVEREWIAAYWASESPPLSFSLPLPTFFSLSSEGKVCLLTTAPPPRSQCKSSARPASPLPDSYLLSRRRRGGTNPTSSVSVGGCESFLSISPSLPRVKD